MAVGRSLVAYALSWVPTTQAPKGHSNEQWGSVHASHLEMPGLNCVTTKIKFLTIVFNPVILKRVTQDECRDRFTLSGLRPKDWRYVSVHYSKSGACITRNNPFSTEMAHMCL